MDPIEERNIFNTTPPLLHLLNVHPTAPYGAVCKGRAVMGLEGKVNEHLLEVYYAREREQQQQGVEGRGKVLVVCETGNDRSAAIVAAYLMTMYGLDTVQAVQFTQLQRFCVTLGDDTKYQLQAYGDILRAMGDVGGQSQQLHEKQQQQQGGGRGTATLSKRRMDDDTDDDEMAGTDDAERYAGRNFAPFVEQNAYC
ncbi:hypothetical protein N0V88_005127 [Collariella sp. IMI 366227]|nr:hypothetical protein N0V88_005127 [Collariella sp. IMI 366227]